MSVKYWEKSKADMSDILTVEEMAEEMVERMVV